MLACFDPLAYRPRAASHGTELLNHPCRGGERQKLGLEFWCEPDTLNGKSVNGIVTDIVNGPPGLKRQASVAKTQFQ
jgi:hypothetical protein